jgi:quercetin dioxygenase-like cupin family protein
VDGHTFEAVLRRDGISEAARHDVPPNEALPEHSHAWEVRGLVLHGRFLACGDATQHCGPGDVFAPPADAPHKEAAGPEGTELRIGRKQRS